MSHFTLYPRALYHTFKDLFTDHHLRALSLLVGILVAIGTLFFHLTERWGWLNSFYVTMMTLTTVGYGDFAPETAAGKLFASFYVVVGIGIFLAFVNYVAIKAREGNIFRRVLDRLEGKDL